MDQYQTQQEFLNELGLEEHLNNYNGEIRKLCELLVEKEDPLLVERIKRRVKRRSGKRAKTAYSRFPKRYSNGRTFKRSKKPRRLIKGTPEAKRYMAKIRAMR